MWAIIAVAVLHVYSAATAPAVHFTLIIVLAGLAGGATGVTAPVKWEGRVYITLLLLPASVALVLSGGPNIGLAVLAFVFWGVMLVSHLNNFRIVEQGLKLKHENRALVDDLTELNATLENKVAARTFDLSQIANRDALTGLANRRGLTEWMQARLSRQTDVFAAVLFLDLDRFKLINDALGHEAGDQVLVKTAAQLLNCLPDNAILARWGGDEFVVAMLMSPAERPLAYKVAEAMIDAAAAPLITKTDSVKMGLSIGIAFYPDDGVSFVDTLHAADLAVAEVKRTGRGHVRAYADSLAETHKRRFDLSLALQEAIASGDLRLAYQPIIDASTGHVAAQEALVRWSHPSLGVINPDEFIRLAEDSDNIIALGDWVLRQACHDAVRWTKPDAAPKVAVNVSVRQLTSDDFELKVMKILTETGLAASRLELEVTETLFEEEHFAAVLRTVSNLRQLGLEVHLDDFGTGYSSLSRLHQFPLTAVKIDRSFVAQEEQGRVIIEGAVMIARRFGFKVIAEGVETEDQARALYALGVNYFQGYLFSRPEIIADQNSYEPVWTQDEAKSAPPAARRSAR